ncbi:MAG: ATP-binding protein [Pseudomonadota bacterium]
MQIRSHLWLLGAVILLPGFLAAAIAVQKVREGEQATSLQGLNEAVRSSSLLVDGQIQRSLGALTALGQSPSLQRGDFEAFYQEALAINPSPDVWTLVLDEQGTQVFNTKVPFGTPPPPAVAQQRVATVLATQQPLVSDLISGPVTKLLLTTIYVPAKPTPAGRFVVAQAFSVEHWKKTALRLQGRPDWVVAVIDRKGRFISRSHRSDELLGQQARPELTAAAAASPEGLIRHATLEGVDSYDAFVRSSLTGWTVAVAAPVSAIEASATQAVAWLSGGVLMALAAAIIGGSLLSRTLIRAMDTASRSARLVGTGGQPLTTRTSLDEINELNSALEDAGRLLAEAHRAREALAAEREQLLSNEQAARVSAEAANVAKDKFLALLGHELRNPLAAIGSATEVLLLGSLDAAASVRLLHIIRRQNRHLKRIVDDLVDVRRMQLGKVVLERRAVDLAAVVRECMEGLKLTDLAHGAQISVDTAEAWVHADPVRVEQIVVNLVTNALKYSPVGSAISVRVEASHHAAVLRVQDAGAGMSVDLLAHVFEPFVQGPPTAGRPSNGLGIGLALVQQLVTLHNGTVVARSDGLGSGSCFEVSLPLAPAQGAQAVDGSQRLPASGMGSP